MEGIYPPVITIDGPSASGKGAVSEFLSNKTGFNYLDSGLLYRLFGLEVLSQGISLSVLADDLSESKRLVECLETKLGGWSKDNKTRALPVRFRLLVPVMLGLNKRELSLLKLLKSLLCESFARFTKIIQS